MVLIVKNYGLLTTRIIYHLPDHPSVLQSFVRQAIDLPPPEHPELRKFLAFWEREIEGPLHSVHTGWAPLFGHSEYRIARSISTDRHAVPTDLQQKAV